MKYFVARLFASISSVQFYQQVLRESVSKSLGFYFQVLLLLTVVYSLQFWIATMPTVLIQMESVKKEAIDQFPDDLTLSWDGKRLSSSYELVIAFPKATPVAIKEMADNLAYLTNKESVTDQSVLFGITPTQIQLIDEGTIIRTESIVTFLGESTLLINKQTIEMQAQLAYNWLITQLKVLKYLYPVGLFLILLVSRTYLVLTESVIIFLFLKIAKINMTYRQLLQLVLALFIPAEIITLFADLAGLTIQTSVLSLSFWIFFIFVFFSIRKE